MFRKQFARFFGTSVVIGDSSKGISSSSQIITLSYEGLLHSHKAHNDDDAIDMSR